MDAEAQKPHINVTMRFRENYEPVAGDIVRNSSGEIFLIGHVNELGGCCDDCTSIKHGELIEFIGTVRQPELIHLVTKDG